MTDIEGLPPIRLPADIASQPPESLLVSVSRGIIIARTLLECMPEGRTVSELVPTVCQGLLAEFIEHNNPRPAYLSRRVQVLGALVAQPIRDGVVAELLEYNDHWLQQGIVMSGGARVGQPPHIYRAWPAAASPLVGHEEFNRGTEQHRTVIWQPRMPRS